MFFGVCFFLERCLRLNFQKRNILSYIIFGAWLDFLWMFEGSACLLSNFCDVQLKVFQHSQGSLSCSLLEALKKKTYDISITWLKTKILKISAFKYITSMAK